MLIISFLLAAFAGFAAADWAVVSTIIQTTFTNEAGVSKWRKASAEIESYASSLTADPKHSSFVDGVAEFVATRTDAPERELTRTDSVTIYTTEPEWYKALPTDLKQYYESFRDAEYSIYDRIVNAAPKPTAGYMGGAAAVAAAVGAAVVL